MQARAKLGVTVVLARPAGVVAHVKLVTALCHGGDAQVELSGERTVRSLLTPALTAVIMVVCSIV